jgi:sterol desaturase/sphingolipid hydroxylase (fatty acid hydroxylase superfamily)
MLDPARIVLIVIVVAMVSEAWVLNKKRRPYEVRDTAMSLACGLGNVAVKGLLSGWSWALLDWLYAHRFANLGVGVAGVVALVVLEDLSYYGYHRTSHRVQLFWVNHFIHHSSERLTLAHAVRQSWLSPLWGIPFWIPLPLLGFVPEDIAVMRLVSLLYQFGLHTEAIGKLGVLEWFLCTPSHHRVHHGKNPRYLDKNFGGIFIVWDRLWGTFEAESEAPRYGLSKPLGTFHPVAAQFRELVALAHDLRGAQTLRQALRALVRSPHEHQRPQRRRQLRRRQLRRRAHARADGVGPVRAARPGSALFSSAKGAGRLVRS